MPPEQDRLIDLKELIRDMSRSVGLIPCYTRAAGRIGATELLLCFRDEMRASICLLATASGLGAEGAILS
jgi:hypothetical protein